MKYLIPYQNVGKVANLSTLLYSNQVCETNKVFRSDPLQRKFFQHVGKEVNIHTATKTAIHKYI